MSNGAVSGGAPSDGAVSGDAPATASLFAVALLGELVRLGVRDVVVCPGSRSQALALAAAAAERAGALRVHVRLDERAAGFFALGVARETGVPAPVIVTSGTAVANLLPAALEAHEGRVPLLLLTADRPSELRGRRSNQTTRQTELFTPVARFACDVDVDAVAAGATEADEAAKAASTADATEHAPTALARRALAAAQGAPGADPAGPVQLNLAFREPLSGWPAGATQDFGAGPMTAEQLFARMAEQRDAEAPERVDGANGANDANGANGANSENDASENDASEARPALQQRDDGWQLRLDWEPDEVHLHDSDALAVVVAGEGAGPEAEAFAHAAGLPLLAEAVSGARFGREAITNYASLIDEPQLGTLIEQVIVFGHPTLVRQVPALLRRDDVATVVVDPHAGPHTEYYDPSGRALVVRVARVAESHDARALRRWLGAWVTADRELQAARTTVHEPDLEAARATGYKERNAYARAEVAALREAVTREMLVESVWRATWPHDRLVLAASRLVRVLDGLAPARRLPVHANRGLAGIDGTVATARGIAAASQAHPDPKQAAGTVRVLLGDLALLHDAGSLLLTPGEPRPRLQLFVGNDGGGSIFDTLEAAGSAAPAEFDRVMFTPQQAELRGLAEAYDWEYLRVTNRGELERLLTAPVTGPMLIEVPLAR